MTQICTRNALRLAAVTVAAGLALAPTAALAIDPLPVPTAGVPLAELLQPSPSPSPSPSPTRSPSALDPVTSQLPEPVREPVQELADSLTSAAPAPAPAPAPPGTAPAPAPAPGTKVGTNSSTSAQQVGAPGATAPGGTGVATFPGLSVGTYNNGIGMSGLPPLAAGMRTASLNRLLGVPNVAEPVTFVPQAAPTAPSSPVPAGLPALIVVVALVTVGGAAAGHLGVLQSRRAAAAG